MASGSCRRANVARGTTARVRRGTEATWQSHRWPAQGAGGAQGADMWQGATRFTRTLVRGATWQMGAGNWRAHGIVGRGNIVGAVTRKRYTAPKVILTIRVFFFHVGLCPTRFLNVQVTWRLHGRWMISWAIDRMDPSPRDRNHITCVMCTLSDHDQSANRSPRGAIRSARSSFFQMQHNRDQTATI